MSRTLQVKAKPNARVLHRTGPGQWLAQIKSPPVDGKANDELAALLARQSGCRKAAVIIKSGASGRLKLVRIDAESAPGRA